MGKALGCGAFLQQLRRTASGDFRIEDARTLEKVADLAADERLFDAVLPVTELLPEFPEETVDPVTANQIRQGRDFRVSPFRAQTRPTIRQSDHGRRAVYSDRRGADAASVPPDSGALMRWG